MLTRLLVGLFSADADELLEDVTRLHVVDALGRQVDRGERLDHLIQQIALRHPRDVLLEPETVEHIAHVPGEAGYVLREMLRQSVQIVEQPSEVQL